MALTVKQQKFVDEYIISGNATEAAIKAGYSKKTAKQMGTENLSKPYLKSVIDNRLEELHKSKVADQQEILEFLTGTVRGEHTESVATAKGVYEDVEISEKDKIKAAELLGKRHSMWTDNVNLTSSDIHIVIGGDEDD